MTKDDLAEYPSRLWAMRIWGNNQYVINQIVDDNGFADVVAQLADLVWSTQPIERRGASSRFDGLLTSVNRRG
jgi:hypothetical protein